MTPELTSAGFWESGKGEVLVNPRDAGAVAQAAIVRPWARQQQALAGHLLFATSGSSGGRKWAALSRPALLASAAMVNRHLSADANDRWLLALPDFHVGGMGVAARCYLAGGEMLALEGKWEPRKFHELARAHRITLSSLVPTQLYDLVHCGLGAPDTLRAVLIGGGRLADSLYQQAMELGWPLLETYGMTEAGSQIATSRAGHRELEILPGWQVRITDQGHLAIRGEPLLRAYVHCEGERCSLSDPKQEGWFDTGDIADLCKGRVAVKGRADRCLKLSGELVNLTEVEQELARMAGELDLRDLEPVVVALADARRGSRLVLCSEGAAGADRLLDSYNRGCSPVQRIEDVCQLNEIPRGPLGKVRYAQLADAAAKHLAAGR
jgi:O-succinylbenzoic acid--CoA ligase